MEAKAFVSTDDYDMTSLAKRVVYWSIEKQDYDFQKATEKSRMHLFFRLDTGATGDLKASRENCDRLRDVFRERILANMVA